MVATFEQLRTKKLKTFEELRAKPLDFGMIALPKERLPGVWDYDRQLDKLLGDPEIDIEDMMPLDVRYDFGRVIGMTEKPDETKDKMATSLFYSVEFGIPPSVSFSILDELNKIAFDGKIPASTAWGRIKQRYRTGKAEVQLMDMGFDILKGTWQDWEKYDRSVKNIEKLQSGMTIDQRKEFRGFFEKLVGASAELAPFGLEAAKEMPLGAAIGGTLFGIAAALTTAAIPTVGEEIPAVTAATLAGIKWGAGVRGAMRVGQLEAGGMFLELAQMKDQYGNRIDPQIAVVSSHAVGAINGGIELAEWQILLATFGIGGKLFDKSVRKVTHRLFTQGTLKELIARKALDYSIALGAETLQEIEQETTNIVFGELAKELNNAREGTDFKPITADDLKARYREVTVESMRAFGLMVLPGTTVSGALELVAQKKAEVVVKPKKPGVVEVKAPPTEVIPAPEKPVAPITPEKPPITRPMAEIERPAEKVRASFSKYQKAMPDATEQEIVEALIEDGLRPPKDMLKKYEELPSVQRILEQDEIDRAVKRVAEPITPEKPVEVELEAKAEEFVATNLGIEVKTEPTDPKNKYEVALGQMSTFIDKDNKLEVWIKETSDQFVLSQIKVEKEKTGLATKFINQLKDYADKTGKKFIIPAPTPIAKKFLGKFNWLEVGVLRENGIAETTLEYQPPTVAKPEPTKVEKKEALAAEPEKTKLRQQIGVAVAKKGLTKKALEELKKKHTGFRKLTGKISKAKITTEQLQSLLKAVQKARPKRVGYKRVITRKTEKKIQTLKESLIAKTQMTEEHFKDILEKEVRGKEPKYIDAKSFITETEGKDIIRRTLDEAKIIKLTESFEQAIAKNPEIAEQVKSLDSRIEKAPKRDPYSLESMRFYNQQAEVLTGAPIFTSYMDLMDTHLEVTKTRTARLKKLENIVSEFKDIAKDNEALRRVSDYIASQTALKEKPAMPEDITADETILAKGIQTILEEYQLPARFTRFYWWWSTGKQEGPHPLPDYEQYKTEINKAVDIYESKGEEELIEYLRTQKWGVIKSGYEPLEILFHKIRPYKTGPTAVGKGHIKIRTDIEYHKQERNILQRLSAYMRQMDMLYNLSPKINAYIRLFDDNAGKFKDWGKVKGDIEIFLRNLKRYNIEAVSLKEI